MIKIPLTQGKVAIVDDDMSHLLNYRWFARKSGNTFYVIRGLRKSEGLKGQVRLHHAVIGYPLYGLKTDHINGDGLLNTRSNLRHVTNRENQWNQGRQREGKTVSGFVGVAWHPLSKKWFSRIRFKKQRKHLGYFETPQEAHMAYQNACKLDAGRV